MTDVDDWDDHWSSLGENVLSNPANDYRTRIILQHLGVPPPGATVLDIGSGQGEFALLLQAKHPDVQVIGLEYSHEGVRRGTEAAAAAGLRATFVQRDLLVPAETHPTTDDLSPASLAVCTEVLEHVDDPDVLLRNAAEYLQPGCRLVVTVPGGPRSAFDRHIGHRQHFTPRKIRQVLESAGFEVDRVERAGFPFFDLYRLVVIARGKQLIADVKATESSDQTSTLQELMTRFFAKAFHWNLPNSPFGWQIVAVARLRSSGIPL